MSDHRQTQPNPQLVARVIQDGAVHLSWPKNEDAHCYYLLIIRTGSVPAYTCLRLDKHTTSYQINNLSRHQRYLTQVLA